jgi:processive 1,2-diacylglycerol beta-glucosyltransferase
MIQLHDAETGTPVGAITEEQLQFLMEELEEESARDRDYYISIETIEMLEADGADPELVAALRSALGGRSGMEVSWGPPA